MDSELFDNGIKRLLLSPEKWKLATTFLPEEAEVVEKCEEQVLKGKEMSSHYHREILIPLKGEYIYDFNGKHYKCVPGTIFFMDSDVVHESYYTSHSNNLTHLWLIVDQDKILGNYYNINEGKIECKKHFKMVLDDFRSGMNLYSIWSDVANGVYADDSFFGRRKLLMVLAHMFIRIIENENDSESDLKEYQREIVETSKAYIRKSFKRGISVDQLARIAGYSKFHFLRLFKQYSGFTVYEYINMCRVNEMENLLKKNYLKKEIAHELGFSSNAAFANWRRKNQ